MSGLFVVRGAGDLATGTILRLHQCGFPVLVTETDQPSAIRRRAAFCEAVYDDTATVEGVTARRIAALEDAKICWAAGEIPLLVDAVGACAERLHPAVLVDAILAKRNLGTNRNMAQITIALGPGFTAGVDVDAVIETMRGHDLGRVLYTGAALPDTGIPGVVEGHAADRVIHAPASGAMRLVSAPDGSMVDIGALVQAGQVIARVGNAPVYATIDGVLRGLIRPGYPVTQGLKIADIDPRAQERKNCISVSDKARAIAGGVLEAALHLARQRGEKLL